MIALRRQPLVIAEEASHHEARNYGGDVKQLQKRIEYDPNASERPAFRNLAIQFLSGKGVAFVQLTHHLPVQYSIVRPGVLNRQMREENPQTNILLTWMNRIGYRMVIYLNKSQTRTETTASKAE